MNIPSTLLNFTLTLIILAISLYLLVAGQSLLIPLVVAVVIWYLIITFSYAIQSIPFVGRFLPYPIALALAILFCFGVLWLLITLISSNIASIVAAAPLYQAKLEIIGKKTLDFLEVDRPPKLSDTFKELNFGQLASNLAQTVAELASSAGIIIIYILFLLWEHHSFDSKLNALIPKKEQCDQAHTLIRKVATQVQSYLMIKTFASFLTGISSYVVMKLVGVDFAEFWALLILLLNFIPTVGSIIATIFPCLLTLVQFDELTPFIIVALCLSSIQFFVGNILEPRLMGKSFNMSAFAIIVSLALWGQLWGIPGMFLCVPIMVVINIIMANFPRTRPVAIILSESGEIR